MQGNKFIRAVFMVTEEDGMDIMGRTLFSMRHLAEKFKTESRYGNSWITEMPLHEEEIVRKAIAPATYADGLSEGLRLGKIAGLELAAKACDDIASTYAAADVKRYDANWLANKIREMAEAL